MAIRKTRGSKTGAVVPFRIEAVDVDGESTLIIAWPKSLKIFKRALDKALDARPQYKATFVASRGTRQVCKMRSVEALSPLVTCSSGGMVNRAKLSHDELR
jgi:hypothetical protein